MIDQIKITSALISVYSKDGIEEIAKTLEAHNVHIYSTGGTYDFLKSKGIRVVRLWERGINSGDAKKTLISVCNQGAIQ